MGPQERVEASEDSRDARRHVCVRRTKKQKTRIPKIVERASRRRGAGQRPFLQRPH